MQAEKRPILRACDACRIRKRKCDGEQPCRNCSKTANHMDDKSVPNCTYTSAIKKRGPKKGYKDNLLHRLESLEAVLNPLSEMTKLEDVATWADRQQEHQPPIVVEEEEFELHLLRLGILYSQLSSNYRLSLIQSYNTAFHQVTDN